MSASAILNPHDPDFDRFLYAAVGEDRKGAVVTVLSALARLNLDPWAEAANLTALGRDAAGARLGQMLARFFDVPSLGRDHDKVAHDLARLLPDRAPRGLLHSTADADGTAVPRLSYGVIAAILAVLFLGMQLWAVGLPGAGG